MKFCKDCKHFAARERSIFDNCLRKRPVVNMVSGASVQPILICTYEREGMAIGDKCGRRGKYWEPMEK